MGSVHVYLENGFDHDRVEVSAAGDQCDDPDVTTRYQVGLASVVQLTVPDGVPSQLRVALPDRRMLAETAVDPAETPHVRVSISRGSLLVQPAADPPMFA